MGHTGSPQPLSALRQAQETVRYSPTGLDNQGSSWEHRKCATRTNRRVGPPWQRLSRNPITPFQFRAKNWPPISPSALFSPLAAQISAPSSPSPASPRHQKPPLSPPSMPPLGKQKPKPRGKCVAVKPDDMSHAAWDAKLSQRKTMTVDRQARREHETARNKKLVDEATTSLFAQGHGGRQGNITAPHRRGSPSSPTFFEESQNYGLPGKSRFSSSPDYGEHKIPADPNAVFSSVLAEDSVCISKAEGAEPPSTSTTLSLGPLSRQPCGGCQTHRPTLTDQLSGACSAITPTRFSTERRGRGCEHHAWYDAWWVILRP